MSNLQNELASKQKLRAKAVQAAEAVAKEQAIRAGRVERAHEHRKAKVADLAALDTAEAARIGKDGLPLPLTPEQAKARRDAVEAIDSDDRMIKTLEAHKAEADKVLADARAVLDGIDREIEELIVPAIDEAAAALIDHWQEKRTKTVAAEKAVRSMVAAMTTKSLFGSAERLSNAFRAGSRRTEYTVDVAPYLNFFARLKSDANARIQP
jgi:hypothetical protein